MADRDNVATLILQGQPPIPAAVHDLVIASDSAEEILPAILYGAPASDANAAIDAVFSRMDELGWDGDVGGR
jgi:hypothetical protein